jgi:hypothetical protein
MRIAIFCNGRSGSTSLFYLINCLLTKEKKNHKLFFEPFNYLNIDKESKPKTIEEFINTNDVLVKTFIDRDNYPYESFECFEDYLVWVYSYFDKIIILEREDKRKQAESLFYHLKLSKNRTISPLWHKQKFYDLKKEDEEEIFGISQHLENEAEFLKNMSKRGYPLVTYENLFIRKDKPTLDKLLEYLKISNNQTCIDEWINSPYKKVRINQKISGLI